MKSTFLTLVLPVAFACLLNAAGNSLWKYQFQKTPFLYTNISDNLHFLASPVVWGGIISFTTSMLLIFMLLSKHNISYIVPLTALTYVFNILAAYLIFHERITIFQLSGIVLIITGVIFVTKQ